MESDLISKVTEGTTAYDYTYDANGNITSDDRHTYVYNEQNQLYRVMDGQTVLGEYTYNAKGQRVKKVAGSTTIYHYDLAGNLIQETNQSGNVIASYVYAGTQRIAKIEAGGSIYYYHNDHLGTPLAMTDSSGNIVWKAAYNPFGKAEVDQSSSVTNNFRFPGQYYDMESALHYNYARYYDPSTGRYLTSDPIGQSGGINLYIYVKNNPLVNIDPTGTITIVVYGEYCGLGSKRPPGKATDPPVPDCVDEACRQHDICYRDNNVEFWYPWIIPSKLKCDRALCKAANKCPITCKNLGIKAGVNAWFNCALITPFGL
jgi:RHS repeat-associated protein